MHEPELDIEAMLTTFVASYERQVPFREDKVLTSDLRAEVSPVVEALSRVVRDGVCPDQAHEAFALVTLLHWRLGSLGGTPTAAYGLARALLETLEQAGLNTDHALWNRLLVVGFEGYCAGRDERTCNELRQALSASQVHLTLAPRCQAVFLSGPQEPEQLAPLLEELARVSLRADAVSCLVDASRLVLRGEPSARALFEFIATLVSVGIAPFVRLTPTDAREWGGRFGPAAQGATFVDDFADAVRLALGAAGHEIRARRRWPRDLFLRVRPTHQRTQ